MPQTESYSETVYYRCRCEHIYDALTDTRMIQAYTQAPATFDIQNKTFSLFNGSIHGNIVKLEKPSYIEEQWRMSNWPDNVYSNVVINIRDIGNDIVEVKLTHNNIPHDDKYGNHDQHEKAQQGWNEFIFNRIAQVLGYAKIKEDDI